jgi:hypothetical protein
MENEMSFMAEVIADSSGKWSGNALRFETASEALEYVRDLSSRWFAVREYRVVCVADPVNAVWLGEGSIGVQML